MLKHWRASCPLLVPGVVTRRFLATAALASLGSFLLFGLVTAMIPNPVFARQIAAEPFAYVTWILSAPLMGLVMATYFVPPPAIPANLAAASAALAGGSGAGTTPTQPTSRASLVGYAGGAAAFLAIGCPVCNKVALVLLGWSGALSVWAPIQPVVGVLSLALLAGTLVWRMRGRARGGACRIA